MICKVIKHLNNQLRLLAGLDLADALGNVHYIAVRANIYFLYVCSEPEL